jgi:hypothetical protein
MDAVELRNISSREQATWCARRASITEPPAQASGLRGGEVSIQRSPTYPEYGCDLALGRTVFDHSADLAGFGGVDTFGLSTNPAARPCGGEARRQSSPG